MIKATKGTRDILPPASAVWNRVEAVAREVFRTFNYHEIRTPIFEETALFARGVGEDTDIVGKEMYTWEDRDGTSLTLRPEATASVMRAYIEHRLDQIPGQVLVFVRYGPSHMFEEWMHNEANIDAARIVWADDLGDTENETLLDYYPARAAWMLEPDALPARLEPYNPQRIEILPIH